MQIAAKLPAALSELAKPKVLKQLLFIVKLTVKRFLCAKPMRAALETGAQAIHPGYGFLSENAEFAENCAKANIEFIGPSPASIRAMALKGAAKALMIQANVPVTPGYHGDDQDPKVLQKAADEIGYPVLIKAVAGGGGKGMRRVDNAEDFAAAMQSAQREGQNAFGDSKILVEKYLLVPRHVEIQVFGDKFGNVVHLFERDCSMQRRHQKVLEEAPAPNLPDHIRKAMGEAAVNAAKAINYVGAGTVEFIVDVANGVENAPFYFMEMNTRLQVEHPVTEEILGIDLVDWQLQIAAGQKLPKSQGETVANGHAIEVRLYAEDAENGFLPSIGKLTKLSFSPLARIETGVEAGDEISIHYDPMIAKIIVHGKNRTDALSKMRAALILAHIEGVKTNLGFLRRLISDADFVAANIDTSYIETHLTELTKPWKNVEIAPHIMDADPTSPWNDNGGWQLNLPPRAPHNMVYRRESHGDLGSGEIISPMPGKIISLMVKNGQKVAKGEPLLILEAMKMEHMMRADIDGEVSELSVSEGQQIGEKTQLLKIIEGEK
ncbi:MAG: 3-methylcrotonyl-CoA carboxylase alpha subunit [Hyphomonadaceae bacterium]|nr:MAG: 3-methylcrotonyl-CoA carboxylase alpha subunit [Hyphomonadaceae bacterium]